MIKFENTKVMNFDGALRGMRNPLESWDRSDSAFCCDIKDCDDCPRYSLSTNCSDDDYIFEGEEVFIIGESDRGLALKLIGAGSDHRKFLRQIFICVDIEAPLYWWKEFDTYKVGTVANSTSTMHKLGSRKVTEKDFSFDDEEGCTETDFDTQEEVKKVNEYITYWNKCKEEMFNNEPVAEPLKDPNYIKLKNAERKAWRRLIQTLPDSFLQTRTVTMSYENARAIYHSDRKNHKQTEWRVYFMQWLKELPYSEFITTIQTTANEKALVRVTRDIFDYALNEEGVVDLQVLYDKIKALEPVLDKYEGVIKC